MAFLEMFINEDKRLTPDLANSALEALHRAHTLVKELTDLRDDKRIVYTLGENTSRDIKDEQT